MTLLEQVVKNKWCVGCGACVAVCPAGRLEMGWNNCGELIPMEIQKSVYCNANCSCCYSVCPAHGETPNETDIARELYEDIPAIQHSPETGYFLNAYVGFSEKNRLGSASGGVATWLLEFLLKTGAVDNVIAVGRTGNPDKLFEFKICQTVTQLRDCSRSAYYPVEISKILKQVFAKEGHYAIIALPCVCKAIRLAQKRYEILRQRIKYVLGLTCGHTCSKYFSEYICALGGGDPFQLREFIFRTKDLSQPASNYGMTFLSGHRSNEFFKQVLWKDGVGKAFNNGYFQLSGCYYCDDIFAECADAVFMDAWLPEYSYQPEGYSIVLLRHLDFIQVVSSGQYQKELFLDPLAIQKVIKSQQGAIARKRCREVNLKRDPCKRIELFTKPGLIEKILNSLLVSCSEVSPRYWLAANKQLTEFSQRMKLLQTKIDFLQKIRRLSIIKNRIFEKFFKRVNGGNS